MIRPSILSLPPLVAGAAAVFPNCSAAGFVLAKHRRYQDNSKCPKWSRECCALRIHIGDFFRSDGAPNEVAIAASGRFLSGCRLYESATARAEMTAEAAGHIPTCSSPKYYGCRFSKAGCAGNLGTAPSCNRPPERHRPDVMAIASMT